MSSLGYVTIKTASFGKLGFSIHLHAHFPAVSGVSFLYFQGLKHPLSDPLSLLASGAGSLSGRGDI